MFGMIQCVPPPSRLSGKSSWLSPPSATLNPGKVRSIRLRKDKVRSIENPRGEIESLINNVFMVKLVATAERAEWFELAVSVLLAFSQAP